MAHNIKKVKSIGLGKYLIFVLAITGSSCLKISSIDKTYQKGFEAYSGERWSECIVQFEESLHLYKLYKSIIGNCRLKCNSQEYESNIIANIEDLRIYERFFKTRDCLNKCQNKNFVDLNLKSELQDAMLYNMQERKPYEYLHLCYFQMNALPKAASAVYTYLVANPDDEAMQNNLKYYIHQPEVDVNEVVDLQSEDYKVLYKLGLEAYSKKNWGDTIANMEEVLRDYMSSENGCRVECERQPDQEWSPDFVITISNNIASVLHCRQQCQDKLKSLNYNSGVDFLADILNYLQISYYHLERINDAAKAVESYLMLLPNDEDQIENKIIYSTLVSKDAFVVRPDIDHYYKRDSYEKELLHFFHRGNNDNSEPNAV